MCSTPKQRRGVTRREPYQRLPNANPLKRPNKQTNKPVHLSKKVKSWRAKICMLKLKTNEKVGDEAFLPGTHERPGANFPIFDYLLRKKKNVDKVRALDFTRENKIVARIFSCGILYEDFKASY